MNMRVNIAGVEWKNPVTVASGTFGSGAEFADYVDLNRLGAVTTKGVANVPWEGNPTPRVAETYGGMMNAVGLQNPGIDVFCERDIPFLRKYDTKIIVNVCGRSEEDYCEVVERLAGEDVDMLEINISCPNVHGGGLAFGADARNAARVCAEVKKRCRKPIYMKLSPNVTDICAIARACEAEGADGLTVTNTLLGMVIDPRSGKPIVSTKMAGFSGPAIKPVSLRMVYQVYEAVRIPIIGAGGVATADDVLCYLSAGASAVQVGAQNLVDPLACKRIIEDLPRKMAQYGIESLQSIIGRAHQ